MDEKARFIGRRFPGQRSSSPQFIPDRYKTTLIFLTLLLSACIATPTTTPDPGLPPTPSPPPNAAEHDATAGAIQRVTRQAQLTQDAHTTETQRVAQTGQAFLATRDARHATQTAVVRNAQATVRAWPEWPLAFTEIFGENQHRWREGTYSDDILSYNLSLGGGKYTWQVDSREDILLTSWPAGGATYTDFHALIEGWFDPDSGAALFGIVFRQLDEQNFYFFGLANSKTPRFVVVQNGDRNSILFDEVSNFGGAMRLEVYAQGSYFIFLVNGKLVGTADDRSYSSGRVGLGAEAFQQGSEIKVGFRFFEVRIPGAATLPKATSEPYPTAEVVQPQNLAFIERIGNSFPIASYFLWNANLDGSGELKVANLKAERLMNWSPDGHWLAFLREQSLWAIARDGSEEKRVSTYKFSHNIGHSIAWSPDSQRIAFSSADVLAAQKPATVGIIDISSGEIFTITQFLTGRPIQLVFSPDGKMLVYNQDDTIQVANATTGEAIVSIAARSNLLCDFGDINWFLWSPDSQWIVHYHSGGQDSWGCAANLNGENLSLNLPDAYVTNPLWDASGRYLYLTSQIVDWKNPQIPAVYQLLRFDTQTRRLEKWLPLSTPVSSHYGFGGVISPNGQKIALASAIANDLSLLQVLTLADRSIRYYPIHLPIYTRVAWSSNSQFIVLEAPSGGEEQPGVFYRLDLSTGILQQISGIHFISGIWNISPTGHE